MKSRNLTISVIILSLVSLKALAVVEFKDGLVHNIDYTIDDNVDVDRNTPYMYTTVNLLEGGKISWSSSLHGFEHSRINILGGSLGWLWAHDSSQINVSGGSMFRLNSSGSSQVNISGGTIGEWLAISGSSQVNISGGGINELNITDSSQVYISDGEINGRLYSFDSSYVNISGGTIRFLQSVRSSQIDITGGSIDFQLFCSGSSLVNIYGGSIGSWLNVFSSSQLNIYGGSIGDYLALFDQSEVQIFGSDFAVDGQSVGSGYVELTSIFGGFFKDEPSRHLTGTLANGDLINNDFFIGNDARIILIPEPATLLLLSLGAMLLRKKL